MASASGTWCRRRHRRGARLRPRDRAAAGRARAHGADHRPRRRRRDARSRSSARAPTAAPPTPRTPPPSSETAAAAQELGRAQGLGQQRRHREGAKAWEHTDAEVDTMVRVNLLGVMHGSRAAVEAMRRRRRAHPQHRLDVLVRAGARPRRVRRDEGRVLSFSASLRATSTSLASRSACTRCARTPPRRRWCARRGTSPTRRSCSPRPRCSMPARSPTPRSSCSTGGGSSRRCPPTAG